MLTFGSLPRSFSTNALGGAYNDCNARNAHHDGGLHQLEG